MALPAKHFVTPEEYLVTERKAETKSEYFQGEVFAMAGAKRAHVRITVNLAISIGGALRGKTCEAFNGDMRVKVGATGMYTYPDFTVVCGKPIFEDENVDTLVNPTVVFEVLSPSTEAYDRGAKFAHYERLDSIKEIVLIDQSRVRIERHVRIEEGRWLRETYHSLESAIRLDAIGIALSLAEVYERVEFDPVPGPDLFPRS